MFNFFCNLALSIYLGSWASISNQFIWDNFVGYMKVIPIFGLFNNSTEAFYNTTYISSSSSNYIPPLVFVISVILSLICCVSVFFIIVKSIKKLFTCFLDR